MTEDKMVGWHYWLNRLEFEQALGDDEGQGILVCCSPWVTKSHMTEWLNNWVSGKEPACQCRRHKRCKFSPRVGKIPWSRASNPLSILAWRIPWTEEPGRLQSMGSQSIGHHWSNLAHILACSATNTVTILHSNNLMSHLPPQVGLITFVGDALSGEKLEPHKQWIYSMAVATQH